MPPGQRLRRGTGEGHRPCRGIPCAVGRSRSRLRTSRGYATPAVPEPSVPAPRASVDSPPIDASRVVGSWVRCCACAPCDPKSRSSPWWSTPRTTRPRASAATTASARSPPIHAGSWRRPRPSARSRFERCGVPSIPLVSLVRSLDDHRPINPTPSPDSRRRGRAAGRLPPRFRTSAFGWCGSQPLTERLEDADGEIQTTLAPTAAATAAEGVILRIERLWPALQGTDGSRVPWGPRPAGRRSSA